MAELSGDIRETVRERYARVALASAAGRYHGAAALESESWCCSPGAWCSPADDTGGRFAISDVIDDPDIDEATKADMAAWAGCIEITPTRQVHEHACSAIIRARQPSACCAATTQASCCEPSAKSECCGSGQHAAGTCGCQSARAAG